MNKTYLIILILAVVGTCFSVGCMFEDKESKTLKEEEEKIKKEKLKAEKEEAKLKAQRLRRQREKEERDALKNISIKEIKENIKKKFLQDQYEAKKKSDKDSRKNFTLIQKLAAISFIIGLLLAAYLPKGRKKWGLGTAAVSILAIVICATLSYYLDTIRTATMIILGICLLGLGLLGVLWLRKSDAFKEVVPFADRLIEKNPEALQEMKANKEIEHTESTKAQVRAVSKRKNNN